MDGHQFEVEDDDELDEMTTGLKFEATTAGATTAGRTMLLAPTESRAKVARLIATDLSLIMITKEMWIALLDQNGGSITLHRSVQGS